MLHAEPNLRCFSIGDCVFGWWGLSLGFLCVGTFANRGVTFGRHLVWVCPSPAAVWSPKDAPAVSKMFT